MALSCDIGETICAACGKQIERVNHHRHHKCDPKFEKRREAIHRREQEPQLSGRTEAQRLNYGFYLMSLNGGF